MIPRSRGRHWWPVVLAGIWPLGLTAQEAPLREQAKFQSPCPEPADSGMATHRSAAHPHEPAGYVAFAEYDACWLPGDPRDKRPRLGQWVTDRSMGRLNNISLASDPTAPGSPPGVIVTRFPDRWVAGRAPVYWNGWDSAGPMGGQKRELYVSLWIKLDGTEFEIAPAVTKLGFIGYGQSPKGVGVNQGFFFIPNGKQARSGRAFPLAFEQQNHVSRNLHQNQGGRPVMTVGVWHHWEAVLRLNTVDRPDGSFQMWVDGAPVIEQRDVVYRKTGQPNGFTMFTWNPTWGGLHATKTREDRILIDDVYLSGVALPEEGRRRPE